jgi:hypothetical protein
MFKAVCLLGRPGSGKSSVAQLIDMFAKDKGWSTQHIYDYKLLQEMFLQEEAEDIALEKRKFSPKGPQECAGFDVIDFSVLDTVLEMMANVVRKSIQANKLFLIEFARNDYGHALSKLGDDLLQDTLLLYLDADVDTCIDRIHRRVNCRSHPYNHFVSEDIMRGYYREDDWLNSRFHEYLELLQRKGIHVDTWTIVNKASHQALYEKVKHLIDHHMIPDQEPKPQVSFNPLFALPA